MSAPESEAALVELWLAHATRRGPWRDSRGRRLEIVYPGRRVGLPGPDLIDAIVSFDHGPTLRCNIEIHLDEGGWLRHGHHRDPAYADVALHVVWRPLKEIDRRLPPRVTVAERFDGLSDSRPAAPPARVYACRREGAVPAARAPAVLRAIGRQGLLRHAERADALEGDIEALGADQALYAAVLRALGYRANARAFRQLAGAVPLALLERIEARGEADRSLPAEALLMGAAGLLPRQRGGLPAGGHALLLDELWRGLGSIRAAAPDAWQFRTVRPANWPPRRIAAAARIFTRPRGGPASFAEALLAEIELAAGRRDRNALRDWFTVEEPPDAFWSRHYDFQRPAGRPAPHLVGRARALEIIVNAVLPFATAVARRQGRPALAAASDSIRADLGAGGWNEQTRYMAATLGVGRRGLGRACAQQGLLRVFRHWCKDKRCETCPVAHAVAQAPA